MMKNNLLIRKRMNQSRQKCRHNQDEKEENILLMTLQKVEKDEMTWNRVIR